MKRKVCGGLRLAVEKELQGKNKKKERGEVSRESYLPKVGAIPGPLPVTAVGSRCPKVRRSAERTPPRLGTEPSRGKNAKNVDPKGEQQENAQSTGGMWPHSPERLPAP